MRELVINKLKEVKTQYKFNRYLKDFATMNPDNLNKLSDEQLLDLLLDICRWVG